jgi:hypothetical protein
MDVSYLPILQLLFDKISIRSVFEFGMSLDSTSFFLSKCDKVISIEMENRRNFNKVAKSFLQNKNFVPAQMINPFSAVESFHSLNQYFDLVFVNGHTKSRWDQINVAFQNTNLIVVQDTEKEEYGWDKVVMPDTWLWFDIRNLTPWTSIITNSGNVLCSLLPYLKKCVQSERGYEYL